MLITTEDARTGAFAPQMQRVQGVPILRHSYLIDYVSLAKPPKMVCAGDAVEREGSWNALAQWARACLGHPPPPAPVRQRGGAEDKEGLQRCTEGVGGGDAAARSLGDSRGTGEIDSFL